MESTTWNIHFLFIESPLIVSIYKQCDGGEYMGYNFKKFISKKYFQDKIVKKYDIMYDF